MIKENIIIAAAISDLGTPPDSDSEFHQHLRNVSLRCPDALLIHAFSVRHVWIRLPLSRSGALLTATA